LSKRYFENMNIIANIKIGINCTHVRMSSDYERDIAKILVEKNEELEKLRKNSEGNSLRIRSVMEEIEALQALFENYNLGMNYFRRARGGRAGLRE